MASNFLTDEEMDKLAPSQPGFLSDADMDKLQGQNDELGTPLEQAKAGVEGLARGASFGLSDVAETKLGISTPERIKGRKEANPITSTVGEIGGTIGSALLAPEMAPAALLERGAVNVAERTATSKIAQKALQEAIQGGAYGAGNLISEKALGNSDLTAEQVMGTVGIGTILGGTIGAGITGAGVALKKTLGAAKIPDILMDKAGGAYARVAGMLSDKDPEAIQKLFTNRFKATISDDERQTVQDEIVQHVLGQDKALSDFAASTIKARPEQMGGLLRQQYGTEINEHQLGAMDNMLNSIVTSIQKMRAEPEIYTATGKIKKLEMIAQGLHENIEGFNKRPDALYGYMNKLKQKIDDLAKFGGPIPDAEMDTVREVRRLRLEMKQTLEDSGVWGLAGERQASYNKAANQFLTAQKEFYKKFAQRTVDDAGNVQYQIDPNKLHVYLYNLGQSKNDLKEKVLAKYMAKSNAYIQEAKQVHWDLGVNPDTINMAKMGLPDDAMETIEANNLLRRLKSPYRGTGVRENMVGPQALLSVGAPALMGHPGVAAGAAVFNALSNPVSMVEKIAALEQAKEKSVKVFNKYLDAMLEGKSADMATLTAVDLAGRQHLLKDQKSDKSSAELFKQRSQEVQELALQPDVLNQRIAATTNSIQGVNQVQGHLAGKLGTAVNYLANTAPKDPNAGGLVRKQWQPKPTDVMQWNRRLAAIQNPYSVLENPTAEGIDALKNVYPEIYRTMQQQVFDRLANQPHEDVPYKAKLKLSRIFGLDLDRTNPQDVARLQASYAQPTQQQNVKRSSRQMNASKASQTDTERIESKLS